MKTFCSYAHEFEELLEHIIASDSLHAKWLNSLSYLENCGARKIAACEHPTLVKEQMLKHAAEEFRHAHHLKRQIGKIWQGTLESYRLDLILGGFATMHYLAALDLKSSRYLKAEGVMGPRLKELSYLLVTYAIELRAQELYPIYEQQLRRARSKVAVRSILLEEEEHLKEMQEGIAGVEKGELYAEQICAIEGSLCGQWLKGVIRYVGLEAYI